MLAPRQGDDHGTAASLEPLLHVVRSVFLYTMRCSVDLVVALCLPPLLPFAPFSHHNDLCTTNLVHLGSFSSVSLSHLFYPPPPLSLIARVGCPGDYIITLWTAAFFGSGSFDKMERFSHSHSLTLRISLGELVRLNTVLLHFILARFFPVTSVEISLFSFDLNLL